MAAPIVLAADINAAPEKISEAISTTNGLVAFWTTDSQAQPTVGSVAQFGFGGPKLRMRVDELAPGRRVKWSCLGDFPGWEGTTVTWDLSKNDKGGITVFFRHADWPAAMPQNEVASTAYTWALILRALKGYVETGKVEPVFAMATH